MMYNILIDEGTAILLLISGIVIVAMVMALGFALYHMRVSSEIWGLRRLVRVLMERDGYVFEKTPKKDEEKEKK